MKSNLYTAGPFTAVAGLPSYFDIKLKDGTLFAVYDAENDQLAIPGNTVMSYYHLSEFCNLITQIAKDFI